MTTTNSSRLTEPARNEAAERLWSRVNQADVPIDIAPMVRDALRLTALEHEVEWRAAERRATVERIRTGLLLHEGVDIPEEYAARVLDEEAAR